jgi:hypothetical protein
MSKYQSDDQSCCEMLKLVVTVVTAGIQDRITLNLNLMVLLFLSADKSDGATFHFFLAFFLHTIRYHAYTTGEVRWQA